MSLSRIPLEQVFRSKPGSIDTTSTSTSSATNSTRSDSRSTKRTSYSSSSSSSFSSSPPQLESPGRSGYKNTNTAPSRTLGNFTSSTSAFAISNFFASMATTAPKGTRTAQMLEYERQAEERAREQDQMNEERDRMLEEQSKMRAEQERIAQEEYEMRMYYEAEALKHAEEVRIHQEEVRRHQERVREHERRIRDHEASAEAFAKVIAMPAKPGRGQISFITPADRTGTGLSSNGSGGGKANGA